MTNNRWYSGKTQVHWTCKAFLEGRTGEMTDRMQRALPYMVEHDWLTAYQTTEGIERALKGVSRRLSRENPIAEAASALEQQFDDFSEDFHEFFPDVEAHISRLKATEQLPRFV